MKRDNINSFVATKYIWNYLRKLIGKLFRGALLELASQNQKTRRIVVFTIQILHIFPVFHD